MHETKNSLWHVPFVLLDSPFSFDTPRVAWRNVTCGVELGEVTVFTGMISRFFFHIWEKKIRQNKTILLFSTSTPVTFIGESLMSASISEFQKTCLRKFSALVMFLDISSTILWRCKLKSPQNGNLKKRIIHLSRNIIHMTYTTFIFLMVFWIRTNTVNVRGINSINMNEP